MNSAKSAAAGLVLGFLAWPLSGAPLYEPLFAFDTNVLHPMEGDLLLDADGSLLGVSAREGAWDNGLIYRVSPGGTVSPVLHFPANGTATGAGPLAGLFRTGDGMMWGTLGGEGSFRGGVFKWNPTTGAMAMTGFFTGDTGALPGSRPSASLTDSGDGFLWGTTASGGTFGRGTVFKVEKSSGTVTSVLSFTGTAGAARGGTPQTPLIKDSAGMLWGTTYGGGTSDKGVIYKINPVTGAYTLGNEFTAAASGNRPSGTLQLDSAGLIWGTTGEGGASSAGLVYKFNRTTGIRTVVASFTNSTGTARGSDPASGLVSDGNGFFWGTCRSGGSGSRGTVFKVNAASGVLTHLFEFTGTGGTHRGSRPFSGLTDDGAGFFWGTTVNGGAGPGAGMGTLYKVNKSTGAFTSVAQFTDTPGGLRGKNPAGGVVAASDGNLWGVTNRGSLANYGTVFKFNPTTGAFSTVVDFDGSTGATKGHRPAAGLTVAAGKLFGTTSGNAGSDGTAFFIDPATGVHALAGQFTGMSGFIPGSAPLAQLMVDPSNVLWGMTSGGGAEFCGTVFKVVTSPAPLLQSVKELTSAEMVYYPRCALVRDNTGSMWGVSPVGGPFGNGCLFRMNTAGTVTRVLEFTGTSGPVKGAQPTAGLLYESSSGLLWGTTEKGGVDDLGTVFKYHILTGAFTTMVEFTEETSPVIVGKQPRSVLMRDASGAIWGTTAAGGAHGAGTLFRIPPGGALTTVLEFSGMGGAVPGANPGAGPLYRHTDGHVYGITEAGGLRGNGEPVNGGQIYRLRFGPAPVTLTAQPIGSVSAVIHGSVHPNGTNTTASFEYGTSPTLADATVSALPPVPAGNAAIPFSLNLTGLTPGTIYYYRIRAANADNSSTQFGSTLAIQTAAQTGYRQWLAATASGLADPDPGADSDSDGLTNAAEYVLGSHPGEPSGHPITVTRSAVGHTVRFSRPDNAETPDVLIEAERSSDLAQWTRPWTVGATTAASSPGVTVTENGFMPDDIAITIPDSGTGPEFVRLKITVAR